MHIGTGAALLAIVATGPTHAADRKPPPMIAALARCLAIADDAQRLACTDVAARALVDAESAREVVIVDRDEVKRTRRSLFGLQLDTADPFAGRDAPAEPIESLETTVKVASAGANGRWTLALAEGGRWQTTESWTTDGDPKPGMAVTIRRAALGSYLLRSPGQRSVRVARVQ